MHKKIFFNVITIFLVMAIALSLTIGFSYVAIDTQKQHIAITEIVAAERTNVERFSLMTINIAENRIYNPEPSDFIEEKEAIQASIDALEHIFYELNNRQYTLIDGSVIDLNLSGSFETLMYGKVEEIEKVFDQAKLLSGRLIDSQYPSTSPEYSHDLINFRNLNPVLLNLSDELVILCLEEATQRSDFSLAMQSISVVVAIFALGLLVFYLTKDFYKPIMKMKVLLKSLSQGSFSRRIHRKRDDEFASLFNDLNMFLDHLEDMISFEDEILQESYIDDLFIYIEEKFKNFIPFQSFGLIYKKGRDVYQIKACSGEICHNIFQNKTMEEVKNNLLNADESMKHLWSPIEMNGLVIGRTYFVISYNNYKDYHKDYVQLLEKKLSMAFYKSLLFDDLLGIVTSSLSKMAEKKDPETGNHLKRMALYSRIMAEGLSELPAYKDLVDGAYIRNIYLTAPMHDIGKVAIRDDILLKPGKLTEEEFKIMKTHVLSGAEVLTDLNDQFSSYNITYFNMAREIALYHHEKFDGSGYPKGIMGKDIPLSAKICAIADVFDALGSKRPYKEAFGLEKCYSILEEGRGHHFDPDVLDVFFNNLDKIEDVYHTYKEI